MTAKKSNIGFLNAVGSYFIELAGLNEYEEKTDIRTAGEVEDLKAVVEEMRKRGIVTNTGVRTSFVEKAVSNHLREKEAKKENKVESNKLLFDKNENFSRRYSLKEPEEAVYSNDSFIQRKLLKQVSVMGWNNMSKRWQNDTLLIEDDDYNTTTCSPLNAADSLYDSILSMSDKEKKRQI